ncbi:amino acid adenylation domain-containing protein [Streptomyces sp. NPDC006879]|uniref:amino acid adenylation domain-containing protein n=1 Tax=Streptomyces sp. NPDC006879 TaxID=3364767 RepID=UPI0036A4B922
MGSLQPARSPRCVHDMVAEQAARTPEATAVSHGDRSLSFQQLDSGADALARRLRAAGVGGGSTVAVLLDRSMDLMVVLTAILKAGGAYLYLDPAEQAEQRARILDDAQARFAVVDSGTAPLAQGIEHVLSIDDPAEPGAAEPGLLPATEIGPDSPAYVCYTSGSTGTPKGVVVSHRAIFRLVDAPSWIDVRPEDVFLQITRVGFDVSTFEIWTAFVRGCRLALAPSGRADLEEIVKTIHDEGVSILWLTSGLFHKLVAHHLESLGTVRHLLAGGDVLSPDHVRRVLAAHPHLTFTNGYGPTENTTFTTCWTTRTSSDNERVPIGTPIDGTTAAILDDAMRPVPPGEWGELWVGGEGVATGYLNKPGATAEKFVADIFGDQPGRRMYRTGDIVRELPDGAMDFLCRADRQVKIRGYRVEPSTVETELLKDPRVEEAAALTHTDGAGDTRLIAHVAVGSMPEEEAAALGASLREQLAATLPAHLVPWAILALPEIPLNANGKVDRAALPSAKIPRNVWNEYVEPTDDLERRLAQIWSDALDVEPIGITDNFFELGGHSLMAAELLAALQNDFNVELPARTLYLRPTIEDLAESLRQHEGTGPLTSAAEPRPDQQPEATKEAADATVR